MNSERSCMCLAAGVHMALLLWNPVILQSALKLPLMSEIFIVEVDRPAQTGLANNAAIAPSAQKNIGVATMARGALFPASRYRLPTPQPILPSGTGDELVSFKTALPITIEKTGIPVPHTTPTLAPRKRPIQWIHALTAAPSGAGLEIGAQTLLPGAGNGTGELAQGDRGSTVTAAGGAVSIEGPLANRGVIKRVIPPYPLWAEEKGIVGQVRIYFTVDVSGHVAPTMRIDWTSGSPELDHLAMEALRQWQFAAAPPGTQRQWGYITFRFSLTQNSL